MKMCKQCNSFAKKTYCSLRCFVIKRTNDATIKKTCRNCKISFLILRAYQKRIFCSKKCCGAFRVKWATKICSFCKTKFTTKPAMTKKRKYCSKKCSELATKGRKMSREQRNFLSKIRIGSANPNWKGESVGLNALHGWIKSRKKKVKLCQCCKKSPPHDLANISQKYKRDLNDWEWLCRKCHMTKDGRLKILNRLARESAISQRKEYNKYRWGKYKKRG